MPRPYIGPRVAFRLPEEVQEEVRKIAAEEGRSVDAQYRELVYAGIVATAEERVTRRMAAGPHSTRTRVTA